MLCVLALLSIPADVTSKCISKSSLVIHGLFLSFPLVVKYKWPEVNATFIEVALHYLFLSFPWMDIFVY